MALKPGRKILDWSVDFFMNATAEKGQFVAQNTVGSGEALDQSAATVAIPANPSGYQPIGVLLSDVVNYDLTKQRLNNYRDEVQIGMKPSIVTKGWVLTNQIAPGITIALGDKAYLHNSGLLTNTSRGAVQTPFVGNFRSTVDEDGYVKVEFNLPGSNPAISY